jgi:hypothetical protein
MKRGIIEKAAYGVLAGTLLIHAFLFWKDRALIAKGYPDFTIFYTAGLMIRQGLGHQLYDQAAEYRVQREFASGVVIRRGALPFNHPPFEALIFVPLTLLPYPAAYVAWNLLNLGILAFVLRLLRPHIAILRRKPLALWMLALLAYFPVFSALQQGQDVVLLLLLQTLAFVALKRNINFLAGSWLGLASFKYHLILPVVVVISLGWKRTKVLLGFFVTCLCLGFLSVTIAGWEECVRYPGHVLQLERMMVRDAMLPGIMPNLRGLLVGWRLSENLLSSLRVSVLVLSLALLLWAIAMSRKHLDQKIELPFALATLVGLLIGYHILAYDLILLTIPLLTTLDLLAGQREFQWRRDLTVFLPAGFLLFTPLYILLALRLSQLNLLALVLLVWLYGIQRRIKAGSHSPPVDQDSGHLLG